MTVSISNLSATWTNSDVTYNAISMNVNTSAYAEGSTILNLKNKGDSVFSVDPFGNIICNGITVNNPSESNTSLNLVGVGKILSFSTISDYKGELRTIIQNSQTGAYILDYDDFGKYIDITTGGVTVPNSVFSAGHAVTIYNNSSSSQVITQGTDVTLRLAATASTGNRTLAQRGICTITCTGANNFVIAGTGLT